jgi:excisionase family DNA binding protein
MNEKVTERKESTFTALMKVEEVAEILSVSKELIYKLAKNKQIKSVRIGSAVRIHPNDLLRYLETNSQ